MKVGRSHVISICRELLCKRKAEYAQELTNLDAAAATETKSSAGDKYETGREMIAQTRQLMERNLAETETALSILERMSSQTSAPEVSAPKTIKIGFGSLVDTSDGLYLLGISLGEVAIDPGLKVTAISLASPLGKVLFGKAPGERVPWKGDSLEILGIATG
jgi:transcription elongation GreA/GreB family factor